MSTCEETQSYIEEIYSISEKLHLKLYDINVDKDLAKEYNVSLVPSIIILDDNENYKGIKFNGIPAGHEINSLVTSILEVSGKSERLTDKTIERLSNISNPIDIKVFVTLGCPHCPGAVGKAHKLALENSNINAEMIEAETFFELSQKYNVSSVPKIVINDKYEFVGDQPLDVFLDNIEKANKRA
ncbi:thioredoxin family protein [Schnuerera sp. xch1]|uniref:protein disulfide oxidoreductase n=1 Tax=Schnuerera sp. xch1 TaxID=2874283 RepID=UPI001CBB4E23|nr:thioredoxin family protein [Schnuerera sp. xch1]MBZ2175135.1 thioredoxin family protein [Schnuerera sp. xch1]